MLTDEERKEIEAELAQSYTARAAAIGSLRAVQHHRRWISDETLADIAAALGMTVTELDAIASFYYLIYRHPVGARVLAVCDSVVCWELGGESLLGYLETRLGIRAGETTPDGKFTLLRMNCLGDCDHAPVMLVNDTLVRNITQEMLDKMLAGEPASEG